MQCNSCYDCVWNGTDKSDIRHVIHHDIPKKPEGYYQETVEDRKKMGERRDLIIFYDYKDIEKLEKFLQ